MRKELVGGAAGFKEANGLEPCPYLRHVIAQLPKASTLPKIENLLPYNLKPHELNPVAR